MADLSIICVTFNSKNDILASLQSACAAALELGLSYETIVVDNASADRTPEIVEIGLPSVTLVRNARNLGFGSANNLAFALATGPYWMLLNPDARVDASCLRSLIAALDDAGVAAAAPSTAEDWSGIENGGMLPSLRSAIGHFLFVNRCLIGDRGGEWRGFFIRRSRSSVARAVEWAGAAVLLVRPEAVRAVGGFDPSIFLYGEDVDIGARWQQAGWRVLIVPEAHAQHSGAGSQGGISVGWVDGMMAWYGRRAGRLRQTSFAAIVATGLAIRAVAYRMGAGTPGRRVQQRRMAAGARRAFRWFRSIVTTGRPPAGVAWL